MKSKANPNQSISYVRIRFQSPLLKYNDLSSLSAQAGLVFKSYGRTFN